MRTNPHPNPTRNPNPNSNPNPNPNQVLLEDAGLKQHGLSQGLSQGISQGITHDFLSTPLLSHGLPHGPSGSGTTTTAWDDEQLIANARLVLDMFRHATRLHAPRTPPTPTPLPPPPPCQSAVGGLTPKLQACSSDSSKCSSRRCSNSRVARDTQSTLLYSTPGMHALPTRQECVYRPAAMRALHTF